MEDQPSVLVVVMTDGRAPYLAATISAFERHVTGPITHRVIHDDSGDPHYRAWLVNTYSPGYRVVGPGLPAGTKAGFAGAIRSAWSHLTAIEGFDHVLHLEEDFTFQRLVDLAEVVDVLEENPHLAQIAFRRQAWYESESAGGFAEKHRDRMTTVIDEDGRVWLEHDLLFTTNPSVYPRRLMKVGWPDGEKSEDRFWVELRRSGLPWGVAGDEVRCGFWGDMDGGREWVHHIGHQRTGHTY